MENKEGGIFINREEKCFIELLNFSIDSTFNFDISLIGEINWNNIYFNAREHNVLALVYYAIKKLGLCNKIDINLLSKWKQEVFNLSIREKFQKEI